MDNRTTIDELKELVKKFTEERDWQKFLSPRTIQDFCKRDESLDFY